MKTPSQFSRAEKKMLWCALLGCGAIALSATLSARAKAQPDWNLPSVQLPIENGYDLYVQAANSIRWSKPLPDPVDDGGFRDLTVAQRNERYSLKRRRAWLQSNAAGFAMFERARALESRYPTPHDELMPNVALLRKLGRYNVARTNTLAREKQWEAAAQSVLDGVQLGFDGARGAPLIGRLSGASIVNQSLQPLYNEPILGDFPIVEKLEAKPARDAARRLEALMKTRPTFAGAFQGERWYGVAQWKRTMKDPKWRETIFQSGCNMTGGSQKPPSAFDKAADKAGKVAIGFGLGVVAPNRTLLANHHRAHDWIAQNVDKPYGATLSPEPANLDLMTRLYFGPFLGDDLNNYRFNDAREQTALRLLLLRLALQAHHQERGTYPTNLSELRPMSGQIPTDPFADKKAFGYRREGTSYRLWSVGPDGIDNGGAPIVDAKRQAEGGLSPVRDDSRGDWVVGRNR